jgi:predicted Zn-dependent protease
VQRVQAVRMSRRPVPHPKKPLEVLDNLLAGHRQAGLEGPQQAVKYLERTAESANSMPNACKFFLYDLLAEAYAQVNNAAGCRLAVAQGRTHLQAARSDAPAHLRAALPTLRLYERGIAVAVDCGEFAEALELCEEALALGLGAFYEAKANSIRRAL